MSKDTSYMKEQKEHAKILCTHISKMVDNLQASKKEKAIYTILIYSGMLAETLFEYEEPDSVMEQSFYRIAELLEVEPEEIEMPELEKIMPNMTTIDRYTEKGRSLAIEAAEQLEKGLDAVHEIVIGLIISDFTDFAQNWKIESMTVERCFRILMEGVIIAAIFEMSAQEFCDILVEDFISEGWAVDVSMSSLSALSVVYGIEALEEKKKQFTKEDIEELRQKLLNVIREEVARHSKKIASEWKSMNPVNDEEDIGHYKEMVEELRQPIEGFFETVGFDDKMGRAVAVARAVGRMVAVSSSEEAGYMPAPVGKMLVWRGMQSVLISQNDNW